MRKHATKIWEVSFAVHCQAKIVKCGYAATENFEVKIIVFPFGCILINKDKGNIQEFKTFSISSSEEVWMMQS